MRSVVAKRLRRHALLATIGAPERGYVAASSRNPTTAKHHSSTTRAVYLRLKKEHKEG